MTAPLDLPAGRYLLSTNKLGKELIKTARKVGKVTAGPPFHAVTGEDGVHLINDDLPGYWVKITKPTSATAPGFAYAGWRIEKDYLGTTYELDDQAEDPYFDRDVFPLIEMSENTSVPNDSIVYAYPNSDGSTYEFLYAAATGDPEEICQPGDDAIQSGDRYYYPCVFVRLDVDTDEWEEGPFGEDDYDCFLVNAGRRDSGDYELTVTSDDGPGRYSGIKQVGTKTLGGYTLPVYVTTDAPFLSPECVPHN